MMASVPATKFFDSILDFLASPTTPEQIISFAPPPSLQERFDYLLEHNRLGDLASEEKAELEEFLRMNHFMKMLKIRARQKLTKE